MQEVLCVFEVAKSAQKAVNLIENSRYKAWLVGGCVRDLIMHKVPSDWDITTNALPQDILQIFNEYKTIQTGIAHGTVAVLIDENQLEITTLRKEGRYEDFRHPTNVNFTKNLKQDLARRDFTMNAIGYSLKDGITDVFNGVSDIKNKVIRCVGNADERFNEDSLRIIRAMRFAAVLGFEMHKDTKNAAINNKKLLAYIAKERLLSEMNKLLMGEFAYQVINDFQDVFVQIIPELEGANFKNMCEIFKNSTYNLTVRWTILIQIAFGVDLKNADKAMKNMRFDNALRKDILMLMENQDEIPKNKVDIKFLISKLGEKHLILYLEILKARSLITEKNYEENCKIIKEIIINKECVIVSALKINGDDLGNIGFYGKQIGDMLKLILCEVIKGKLINEKQSLINFASNTYK